MTTGYFGVPGKKTGRFTVHAVWHGKPICGTKMPNGAEFQFCAFGVALSMIECMKCKKKLTP